MDMSNGQIEEVLRRESTSAKFLLGLYENPATHEQCSVWAGHDRHVNHGGTELASALVPPMYNKHAMLWAECVKNHV